MSKAFPLLDEFLHFVTERWRIHQRRLSNEPPPWTKDPILSTYRFTNVRREDDRVTIWLHREWLRPHCKDYDTVVFAMCLARLVNLPTMLSVLGYPQRWDASRFVRLMEQRRAEGYKTFTGAYMVNAVGATKGQSKASYLAAQVLPPLWSARKELGKTLQQANTLAALFNQLNTFHGFGAGFMAAQVIADVKQTPVGLRKADWLTFAHSGPGSRRGLNYLCGYPVLDRWKEEEEWHGVLMQLRSVTLPKLPTELRGLDAQNLQNCLCEFSKYCRVKFDNGRTKKYFVPSKEPYVQS